jgi:alkylation response protein AidB-like acyl-CoA dehydrogenase
MGRPGHQDPRLIMTKVTARVLQPVVPCGDELRRSRNTGFSSLNEPLTAGELAVGNRMRQQLICAMLARLQCDHRATIEHVALATLHTGAGGPRMCADARDILAGNGIPLNHQVARHCADIGAVYTREGTDTTRSRIGGRTTTGLGALD